MTGFHVHRSNRLERLADVFTEALRTNPPRDPFAVVPVVVGSRGMARWLRNRVAGAPGLGVCAGLDFPFPAPFLRDAALQVLGVTAPDADPWDVDALAWRVLDVLRDRLAEPDFEPVRRALGADALPPVVGRRHLALAHGVADVLDRYVHARPGWIEHWRAGRTLATPALPDEAWQAALWRELESRVGAAGTVVAHGRTWPSHLAGLLAALGACPDATPAGSTFADVHVFGLSTLPPLFLQGFATLGRFRRVDLYLLTPSDGFWGDYQTLPEARRLLRRASPAVRQSLEAGLAEQHPLLTGLGRLSRDFQNLLEGLPDAAASGVLPGCELFDDDTPSAVTPAPRLLARLQRHLRLLASPRQARVDDPAPPAPDDDSLRVHACAGPTRQVEALRDALLGLMVDHPHLQPRDVVVMTPDVETFAPLVAAAFSEGGTGEGRADGATPDPEAWGAAGAPRLPVEIADLSLRRTNPVAEVLLAALELAQVRVTASAVADLVRREPVRTRFGLEPDDVDVLRAWLADSGIRWGVDAADRARDGLPADDQNTFRFGLERLALGAVAGESTALFAGRALPLAVGESDIERLGRFATFCGVLFDLLVELRVARPADGWRALLPRAVHDLTATSAAAAWLTEQVLEGLDEALAQAACWPGPLGVDAVHQALAGRFQVGGDADRANTGAVTMCALAPMRSVPFKVVALLGLDDDRFPRRGARAGFDLTRLRPAAGDREPRDEDRHLLLEAVLSAREHLMVFYSGRDASSDERLPPAVPVAELLDAVELSFAPPAGLGSVRQSVLVEHPVQPFSERAFAMPPRSFDRRLREVALRLRGPRAPRSGLFPPGTVLPAPVRRDEIRLDDLVACLRNPARFLLQRRLGLYLADLDESLSDREALELERLDVLSLEASLFAALVADEGTASAEATLERVRLELSARGELPHGAGGRLDLSCRAEALRPLVAAAGKGLRGAISVDVSLELADGRRLVGRVPSVVPGGTPVDAQARAIERADRLLGAWVSVLALQAAQPLEHRQAHLYGLGKGGAASVALRAPDGVAAADLLQRLVGVVDEAGCRPLALFEHASKALASTLVDEGLAAPWAALDDSRASQLADEVHDGWIADDPGRGRGDGDDPYVAAAWPNGPAVDVDATLRHELLRLAELVWAPLLRAQGPVPADPPGEGAP
jgi:exodeoxyribonuclease V gamma subunit